MQSEGVRLTLPSPPAQYRFGMRIRRIRNDEGLRLRALRLRALADSPMAFGATLAEEEAFDERVWHERAAGGATGVDRITFVAERGAEWIGIATGLAKSVEPSGPMLVGMFVAPEERGRGVGAMLVEAIVDWARAANATELCLWVTSTNAAAISLYRRCGFESTGEDRPRRLTPSVVEIEMVRHLGRIVPS